jgi:ATP-GRASP peptide maturase of grasp-with-spasm system
MIVIFTPFAEKTVNRVMEYLLKSRYVVWRITESRFFKETEFKGNLFESELEIITSFWYRKGQAFFYSNLLNDESIMKYLGAEYINFSDYVVWKLATKRHLGNYFDRIPNKLQHLWIAKEAGISIPQTLVTQFKDKLLAFQQEVGPLITKSIKDFYAGVHDSVYYYNHTERVTPEALADMPDTFFPTLVQEELQKAYELRVVFVCRKLYTMAIFSQNDSQTSVDWRNYNHKKPNRTVPYTLPSPVEAAILRFIGKSGLNTGAIDMVVTTDKRYVFLECNPNGQISMVSENCNYPIEKDIALYLAYGTNPGTGA